MGQPERTTIPDRVRFLGLTASRELAERFTFLQKHPWEETVKHFEFMNEALNSLDPQEQEVLRLRLEDNLRPTRIGQEMGGLSRHQVRRLLKKSIANLDKAFIKQAQAQARESRESHNST